MKLNHNTYVGKKCLYFITYKVLRGLKHLIRTHLKIQLNCRAAVLREVKMIVHWQYIIIDVRVTDVIEFIAPAPSKFGQRQLIVKN